MYSTESLHAAVVEVIAKQGSRFRYTTIQNWANNIYNLVTKRAMAYRDSLVEWVDGNLGSRLTMKYPSIYMMEPVREARYCQWPSLRRTASRRRRENWFIALRTSGQLSKSFEKQDAPLSRTGCNEGREKTKSTWFATP
jgi:hypothetical protein